MRVFNDVLDQLGIKAFCNILNEFRVLILSHNCQFICQYLIRLIINFVCVCVFLLVLNLFLLLFSYNIVVVEVLNNLHGLSCWHCFRLFGKILKVNFDSWAYLAELFLTQSSIYLSLLQSIFSLPRDGFLTVVSCLLIKIAPGIRELALFLLLKVHHVLVEPIW